jgi:hypothetical protein
MKSKFFFILGGVVLFSVIFAKNINNSTDRPVSIQVGDDSPVIVRTQDLNINQSREEIDLITDDFEGDVSGWNPSAGWQLTSADSNSETHSFWSPDELFLDDNGNAAYKSWDLFSPTYSLPVLGDGESMHFGFYLNVDMPDSDGDGDGYLEDYYAISLMDVASIAWHVDSFNSFDGNNYWCGFEDVGNGNSGYLDAWVQYLDTPSFTVPASGVLSADMTWGLESPAGAEVAGTCTDGWDQANVQISLDGGSTFMMLEGSRPYDFDCGYGMVYNGFSCSGNGDCAGWGGQSGSWVNVSFDLSDYAGQDAVVRFALYSDPAESAFDDALLTGFQVDNIEVSDGVFSDNADGQELMTASGAVWVDQFYDYWSTTEGEERPGSFGWEEYQQGFAFNGNVFLDVSDFQGKDVKFRFQTRYDENQDGGAGNGLYIDDFRVYKISGGNYPAPTGLAAEAGDNSVSLSWNDMNFSGTVDYQYDNDTFSENDGIIINGDGFAWAGARIDAAGASTIESVSVFNINEPGVEVQIGAFGTFGTLFSPEVTHSESVVLAEAGWNVFQVDWDMNGPFIIAHTFDAAISAVLDITASPSMNSMTLLSGTWDVWGDIASSNGLTDGEWGIRTTVNQAGADVVYNVYRDGVVEYTDVSENSFIDEGVVNNSTYLYEVTATYSDGEESGSSNSVEVTPQAQTVYEVSWDDGTSESGYAIGSGNFVAVGFNASSSSDVVRFKWYQIGDGGAFYIKMFEDENGVPGQEVFSKVVAGGLVDGWNEHDLLSEELVVSGDFWVGIKAFSSTSDIGLDNSSSGSSYASQGSTGSWEMLDETAMIRLLLDGEGGGSSCAAGDVNQDDTVNVLDVVTVVNFIMGVTTPSDDQFCAADFNEDGGIDVLDIVNIVNVIMGS